MSIFLSWFLHLCFLWEQNNIDCAHLVVFSLHLGRRKCLNQDKNIDILLPHLYRTILITMLLSSLAAWLKSKISSCVALVSLLGVRTSRLNLLSNTNQWKTGYLSLFFFRSERPHVLCVIGTKPNLYSNPIELVCDVSSLAVSS